MIYIRRDILTGNECNYTLEKYIGSRNAYQNKYVFTVREEDKNVFAELLSTVSMFYQTKHLL